jgi:hypothetical protein
MADKEIKINEYELENYNSNLKELLGGWNSIPSINTTPAKKSTGDSAECINDNCFGAKQVKKNFSIVLENSIGFFEAIGISFSDADNESANAIKGNNLC